MKTDRRGIAASPILAIVVVGLVALIGAAYLGWINIPGLTPGSSGIKVYLLDKDMKPMAVINPNTRYTMSLDPLGMITYNGQTVGGVGFSLWVRPTGGTSGEASISFAGYREIVGTIFSSNVCSGTKSVSWGSQTELVWDKITDSWIQVTTATLSFIGDGSYIVNVRYDVTASGIVDGITKTATANPSTSVSLVWATGTLSLEAGIKNVALSIH